MASIRLDSVCKQFGEQIVLRNITVDLRHGEIVGLVGANGCGKTTLLRLIAGQLQPDTGSIGRSKDLAVGYLSQEPDIDLDRTLHDEVGRAFDEHLALEKKLHHLADQLAVHHAAPELDRLMQRYDRLDARFHAAGGYTCVQRLNEILGGLGFTQPDHHLPVAALSGGQKCRAALAKLLLQESDYLLLDEPTNHLDIDAARWLEKFLARHQGGALLVSHDRYLLDRVTSRIIELERTHLNTYPGNYSNYVQSKELQQLTRARQYQKDRDFIEQERAFISKHLAGQRTKEAQGRRTRLQRRIANGEFVLERPTIDKRPTLDFKKTVETVDAGAVLRVDQLAKAFDPKKLFADLTLQVYAGQRFGITGPNGTGKSTLLKIVLGQLPPDAGSFEFAPGIICGYYAQDVADLDTTATVIEETRRARPDFDEHHARSYLARFRFTGDDVFKPVSALSGGEQSRLRLIKLILSAPNLLILDEPTNHLDIASCEALENALLEFPGTVILVSHDRYLLDRIVDHLLVIRPEGHALYAGNYSFYLQQVEGQRAVTKTDAKADRRREPKARRRDRPEKTQSPPSPFDRCSVEEIEHFIVEREERIAELTQRFADPAVCRDPDALADLHRRLDLLNGELHHAERSWSERADSDPRP